jgi:hypothetical protein
MLSRDAYYSLCFAAGAVLLRGPFTPLPAQDANRAIVESPHDVFAVVERLVSRSGDFKEAFDNAVARSRIDGTQGTLVSFTGVNSRHRADDLHDAAKRLAEVFDDKQDKNNPAVRDQVEKTIAAASELNRVMLNHRFSDKLQRNWAMLCSDLNALAEIYDLSPLGGEDQSL